MNHLSIKNPKAVFERGLSSLINGIYQSVCVYVSEPQRNYKLLMCGIASTFDNC